MDREREGDGERESRGVRGIADGGKNKTRKLTVHAALPSAPFLTRLMDTLSQNTFFKKVPDSIWRSRKATNRAQEE